MRVDSKESKKDKKELLFDGGDDDVAEEPKLSRAEKKQEKYADQCNEFKENLNADKYADGIVTDRGITDCFCALLFIAFCFTMIGLLGWCISKGDIKKYVAPISYYGADGVLQTPSNESAVYCGIGDAVEYPKLYFTSFDISIGPKAIFDSGICIKECPTLEQAGTELGHDDVYGQNNGFDHTNIYGSRDLLNICTPIKASLKEQRPDDYANWMSCIEAMGDSSAGQYFKDLYLSSTSIYISFLTSFIWSIFVIYFLSLFAEYVAWAMVIGVQIGLIVASMACLHLWQTYTADGDERANGALAAGGSFTLVALVFACMIYCGYNQLKTAIDVLDASADFLAGTKRIFIVPIIYFFIQAIFVGLFLMALMSILATGEISPDLTFGYQMKSTNLDPAQEKNFTYIAMFQFFGLLWILNFIMAKTNFITMCSASSYYFSSSPEGEGSADVMQSVKFAYFNHFGSLAMGSFIIALIQFIRIVFQTVAEKAREASGDNAAVKAIICCASCCLKCIEEVCDYISKLAYAYMAVSGEGFCTSAWNGFLLNMTFGMEFAWANTLAAMFVFMGKIFIVVLNCFTLYGLMSYRKDLEEIKSLGGPFLICILSSYITANLFLGMMDEAVVALLTCLCIDRGINGGEAKRGPPTFHDSVEKMASSNKPNELNEGGSKDKYKKFIELV